jgi:hypothetical protein
MMKHSEAAAEALPRQGRQRQHAANSCEGIPPGGIMKKLILLILVAAVGYLAYTNPDFTAHKAAISEQLPGRAMLYAQDEADRFSTLDYSNFLIASATKDTVKMTMVSYGFLGRVKIADEDWRP